MFKDNSAQYFRKTRYELIKTTYYFWPLKYWRKKIFLIFFSKTKWPPFPEKIKYYFCCFFCKIGLVSNHLRKKQLYTTLFEWIIGLYKWHQKQKNLYGGQFSERGSIFGWLYLGNDKSLEAQIFRIFIS